MRAEHRKFSSLAVIFLVLLLGWDATGGDLMLARHFGGAAGFPLRDHWLLSTVLHDAARRISWILVLGLCAAVVWPVGPLTRLPFMRRVQMPASALMATGVVVALKSLSETSCPWDLSEFGGVAYQLSHWRGWFSADGGRGHCFPAGHAASGFAFLGCYFALRGHLPRLARAVLVVSVAAGLLFGFAQQMRGAHFLSHTLWTAWLCWMVVWLTDPLFSTKSTGEFPAAAQ